MTAVPKRMLRRLLISGLIAAGLGWITAGAQQLANPSGPAPANQLCVSGNACGPAALINSFRFGSKDWQRGETCLKGNSDKERILCLIREIGMRPSKNLPGRPRWSRSGVGVADLRDIANEMTMGQMLPKLQDEVFFRSGRETPERLLQRVHQRFSKSVSKGFPPVLSLRRCVLRKQASGPPQWVMLDAHFITVTGVGAKPGSGDRSFEIHFIDPWGGRFSSGSVRIPEQPLMPGADGLSSCLEAVVPGHVSAGDKSVRKNETPFVTVSAAIGRW